MCMFPPCSSCSNGVAQHAREREISMALRMSFATPMHKSQTSLYSLTAAMMIALGTAAATPVSGQITVKEPIPQIATIDVNAAEIKIDPIPRTVFGTFLEPIGNSTYNGLWAEILQNPSLEENLWNAEAVAHMIQEQPQLARASQLGLPLPWEPLDQTEGNRYEPRWGDAANSWRSLAIFGVPGKATGIKQQVYLPLHRELEYQGSLYAKHLSGPAELSVSLRAHAGAGEILSEAKLNAAD